MIEELVSTLFPEGRPLVYASALNETHYGTQWTVYHGRLAEGLHRFEFLLELDPVALGQGGSVIRQRATLLCDDRLQPVRYETQARESRLALTFESESVLAELPDGSKQTIPREGAGFLLESNMPGQTALLLARASHEGRLDGAAELTVFMVTQLLVARYQLSPAEGDETAGRHFHTSFQEELTLDEQGVLTLLRRPGYGVTVQRVLPAPPLPEWHDEPLGPVDRPTYSPPPDAAFELEDVMIEGPVTPIGATITIPAGEGPFPAVLFVGGSGSHDRHGIAGEIDIGTHEIVDHLAEEGFLGLRYDTRGAGATALGEDVLDLGLEALIEDARACLSYLERDPRVDAARIFLIGHSQGGTIALALAAEPGRDVAGVALLAALGRPLSEVIADQIESEGRRLGLSDEQIEQQTRNLYEYVELAEAGDEWERASIPDHLYLGARQRRWLSDHLRYRTTDLITAVRCPLLICQGGKDFQVRADRDALPLFKAAQDAGKPVTYMFFPNLDHLFKQTEGESTMAQYFDRTRRVDREFLERLGGWLKQQA